MRWKLGQRQVVSSVLDICVANSASASTSFPLADVQRSYRHAFDPTVLFHFKRIPLIGGRLSIKGRKESITWCH